MISFIVIIIIIILLTLFIFKFKKTHSEGFSFTPKSNKIRQYAQNQYNPKNIKGLDADKWETRFPYMVKAKYSYDDTPIPKDEIKPILHDNYALLKELPTQIKNVYHAKVNPCLYFSIQP